MLDSIFTHPIFTQLIHLQINEWVEDNDFLTMLDTCTSFSLLNNLCIKRKYGRFSDVIIHYLCSNWKQSFPRLQKLFIQDEYYNKTSGISVDGYKKILHLWRQILNYLSQP